MLGARTVESATRVAVRRESEGQVRIGAAAPAARRREPRGPEEERHYSWLEDHLARLDGKEVRGEYYARLEREPTSPIRASGVAG